MLTRNAILTLDLYFLMKGINGTFPSDTNKISYFLWREMNRSFPDTINYAPYLSYLSLTYKKFRNKIS